MKAKKVSLFPMPSLPLPKQRINSTEFYGGKLRSISEKKRPTQSIPTSRHPSPSPLPPPRMATINALPQTASKKQLYKRSLKYSQKGEEMKLDNQIMVDCKDRRVLSRPKIQSGMSR